MKKTLSHFSLIAAMLILSVSVTYALLQYKQRTTTSTPDTSHPASETSNQANSTAQTTTGAGVSRPKTLDEAIERGKLLEEQGYFSLALAEYEAAIKNHAGNVQPLLAAGNLALRLNDIPKAKAYFQQILQYDPQSIDAQLGVVRTLLAQRNIDEARTLLENITAHNQTSRFYQGMVAAAKGDHDAAKAIFNDIVNQPESDELRGKADSFLAAYAEFNAFAEGDPLHRVVLLGRSYNQVEAYDLAIAQLLEVVKSKKDYRDAWILLGYAYLRQEKFPDARDALEEARKLDPDKPEPLFYLGITYYGLKDLDKAIQYFELAKKKGYEPVIQINQKLAEIYLIQKNYPKSAQNYEEVLALNGSDVNYYVKPLWIYLDILKEPQKAVALAEKAVKAHPDQAMSYNLLGWAYLGNKQYKEAQQYLDKALTLDPKLNAVHLNYGMLYEQQGRLDAALASFKKAYQMGNGDSISQAAAAHYNRLMESFQDSLKANVVGN